MVSPIKSEGQEKSVPRAFYPVPSPLITRDQRKSPRSRGSPLSSRKRKAKQPLHIRMNLTENQMDKITNAFTNKVNQSPSASGHQASTTPNKQGASMPQGDSSLSCSETQRGINPAGGQYPREVVEHCVDFIATPHGDIFPSSLAQRRHLQVPMPLLVDDSRGNNRTAYRLAQESVPHVVSPMTPVREGQNMVPADEPISSTWASPHAEMPAQGNLSPHGVDTSGANGPILDMYRQWERFEAASNYHDQSAEPSPAQRARRSKSTSEGLRNGRDFTTLTPAVPSRPMNAQSPGPNIQTLDGAVFSPLSLYFHGKDFPSLKKGGKNLIGRNGWLERTGAAPLPQQKPVQKKLGILENIKKIAKGMTAEIQSNSRRVATPGQAKDVTVKESGVCPQRISLDAREQSLLYCELEYHLTTALNTYITTELDKGHLVPDNLKKVSDWWAHQGRPKVVGFRYDIETQLQLISLHVKDFNFYGRRQGNLMETGGLLDTMKTNARQMRVHSFCHPDSVIAKQLVDTQSLFNLINASNMHQAALTEMAEFFKAVVERQEEREARERREMRRTRISRPGQSSIDFHWARPADESHNQRQGRGIESTPHKGPQRDGVRETPKSHHSYAR